MFALEPLVEEMLIAMRAASAVRRRVCSVAVPCSSNLKNLCSKLPNQTVATCCPFDERLVARRQRHTTRIWVLERHLPRMAVIVTASFTLFRKVISWHDNGSARGLIAAIVLTSRSLRKTR